MTEEILHIHCEEDGKQVAYLQSAMEPIMEDREKWPEVPTARYDELNGIYDCLRERLSQTRPNLLFLVRVGSIPTHNGESS